MTNSILHSVVSIRIVLAFIEFLSSVQSSLVVGSVDEARISHLKETIIAIFNISPSTSVPNASSQENEQNGSTSAFAHAGPSFSLGSTIRIDGPLTFLFHHFHLAVEALGFYHLSLGQDYWTRKRRAKQIYKDAIAVLIEAGHMTFDLTNLAEGVKILGNNAMESELYGSAIEMYSIALALVKDNAVYFCNRAAAFTKVGRFEEAIRDCWRAIKLEPKYVMAYYRLGCAYYAQGKNLEAIRESFLKVLELDPHNHDAMVCLQLADFKLRDEVASLTEQIGSLRVDGGPAVTRSKQKGTVLMFRGPEEGGNGSWELVEDTGNGNDGDTISVADFIDAHVRNMPPPQ